MATSPVIELRPNLAAMLVALHRNRAVPVGDSAASDQAQRNVDALERAIADRVNALIACDGVTLADIAGAGL
jgi:hypothetical protein